MRFGKVTILAFGMGFLPAASAHAWKPITHAYLAQQVVNELIANDGYLNIEEVDFATGTVLKEKTRKLKAVPELYEAVKNHPAIFYNGVVGPDGYPDILTGQNIIHPPKPEGTGTDHWWNALWNKSHAGPYAKPQNLAFAMGMYAHSAGDMFAHSFVNAYTGAPFTLDMNAAQHIVLEGYLFERTPPIAPHQGKSVYEMVANQGMNHELAKFIRDALDPYAGLSEKAGSGYMKSIPWHFGRLRAGLIDTRAYFESKEQQWRADLANAKAAWAKINGFKHPIDKAAAGKNVVVAKFNDAVLGAVVRHAIVPYINAWVADIEEGLIEWPKTSHRVAMALMFQDPAKIQAEKEAKKAGKVVEGGALDTVTKELSDFWLKYGMRMVGVPDKIAKVAQQVAEFTEKVGKVIDKGTLPIKKLKAALAANVKAFSKFVIEEATGINLDKWHDYWMNPAKYIDVLFKDHKHPNALPEKKGETLTVASLNKIMGLKAVDHMGPERFDYRKFPPAFNTVNMIKLSFLSVKDNNDLIASLKSTAKLEPEDKNVMLGSWLGSMDAGNQWLLGNKLVYARDCGLFRKVFLGQTVPKGGEHEPKDLCIEGKTAVTPSTEKTYAFALAGPSEIEIEAGKTRPFGVYGAGSSNYTVSLDAEGQPAGSITNKERRDFIYVAPSKVDKPVDVHLVAVHENKLFDAAVTVHVVPALALAPAVEAVSGGDSVTFHVQTARHLTYRVAKGRGTFGSPATLASLNAELAKLQAELAKPSAPVSFFNVGAKLAKMASRTAHLVERARLHAAIRKEEATYYAPADAKEGEQVTVEVVIGRGNKEGDRTLSHSFVLAPKNAADEAALEKQLASSETLQTGLKEAVALEKASREGLVLLTSFKPFTMSAVATNVAAMKFSAAMTVAPGAGGALAGPGLQGPSAPAAPPARRTNTRPAAPESEPAPGGRAPASTPTEQPPTRPTGR